MDVVVIFFSSTVVLIPIGNFSVVPVLHSVNDMTTLLLHLIQINHQPDATIFQFIILTFVYSSTAFSRPSTGAQ